MRKWSLNERKLVEFTHQNPINPGHQIPYDRTIMAQQNKKRNKK